MEVLQVQRVLDRMNVFLRLMHEGLITAGREERTINAEEEFARAPEMFNRSLSVFEVLSPFGPSRLWGMSRGLPWALSLQHAFADRFARIRCSLPTEP